MRSNLFFTILSLSSFDKTYCKQTFTTQPSDDNVRKEGNHWLTCVISEIENDQSLQWFKNGRRLQEEKTRIKIESKESSSMLYITGIILSDGGQYYCAVVSSIGENIIKSRTATLVVQSLPSQHYPYCSVNTATIITDSVLTLSCFSENVEPPVTLSWAHQLDIKDQVTTLNENGRNISLQLTMMAKKHYNDVTFTCKQESSLEKDNYTMCSVGPLDILYKPDTVVQYASPALPGRETILFCQTSSNPPLISYRWIFDPHITKAEYNVDETGQILKLLHPKIKQSGTNITCVATNEVGHGSSSVTLQVSYSQINFGNEQTTGTPTHNQMFESNYDNIGLSLDVIIIIAAGVVIIVVLVVLVPVYHYCLCHNDNTIIVDSLGKEVTQPEVYYETREGVILRHTIQDRSLPRVPPITEVYGHWRHSTASQVPNDLEQHSYTYIDTEND